MEYRWISVQFNFFMHYLYNYVFFLSLLKLYVNPIRAFTTALEEQ